MIQQGRPKQLVDQLSPHRCREWHSGQTSVCLRLMPSLGGEHPSKKQKSEEVMSKPSDGPKLDSVRAPTRGSKVEWHGIGKLRIFYDVDLSAACSNFFFAAVNSKIFYAADAESEYYLRQVPSSKFLQSRNT
ncbi:hypothetical protein PIB30_082106 [Stylosanthes scabra]|uniref:Uncharacterized protein n=1 Tax=Stylosanthes scabra TaxID=79078 RepID=A0ABU6RSG8_9FABA|nr:hypothetical protein [Stylosanthes scabra]